MVGTTGWQAHEAALREQVSSHDAGVVAAPNFALGVNIFIALAERAAELAAHSGPFRCVDSQRLSFGSATHPRHSARTRGALRRGGLTAKVSMAPTRAGWIPGIHTVGFDAVSETIR